MSLLQSKEINKNHAYKVNNRRFDLRILFKWCIGGVVDTKLIRFLRFQHSELLFCWRGSPFPPSDCASCHWLGPAGEDRCRRGHSWAPDARLPEPPGPGGGRGHPGGKTEQLAHRLRHQLPCRSEDCASAEEPLDPESFSSNLVLKCVGNASTWSLILFFPFF